MTEFFGRDNPNGWHANFSFIGIAHSAVRGSAWEPAPWRAVQAAAWEALTQAERDTP